MKKRERAARRELVRRSIGVGWSSFDRGAFLRSLADGLRNARHNLRATQDDIAEAAGISQPEIARIENQNAIDPGHLPRLDTLARLAHVFGRRMQISFLPFDDVTEELIFELPERGNGLDVTSATGADEKAKIASVGGELRRLRMKAGLTQAQLAELIGVEQPLIAKVERSIGQKRPRVDLLDRAKKAVHATTSQGEEDVAYHEQRVKMAGGRPPTGVQRGK